MASLCPVLAAPSMVPYRVACVCSPAKSTRGTVEVEEDEEEKDEDDDDDDDDDDDGGGDDEDTTTTSMMMILLVMMMMMMSKFVMMLTGRIVMQQHAPLLKPSLCFSVHFQAETDGPDHELK